MKTDDKLLCAIDGCDNHLTNLHSMFCKLHQVQRFKNRNRLIEYKYKDGKTYEEMKAAHRDKMFVLNQARKLFGRGEYSRTLIDHQLERLSAVRDLEKICDDLQQTAARLKEERRLFTEITLSEKAERKAAKHLAAIEHRKEHQNAYWKEYYRKNKEKIFANRKLHKQARLMEVN